MNYTVDSVVSLISHIHSASADFLNRRLSKTDSFVSSHGFILFLLSENQKMTMGQIAEKINRDKSTTTVLIKKLLEKGLVKTENCSEDSRKKIISLTEDGKKYNALTGGISRQLLEACYKDFTGEEKETLLKLLVKMSRNIEEN
ncbi:MarR family winged helix-turn-helix transcriptional regulator [Treponema sp.]|uniref:MarR family winged helix-turn-helix transcriptional regulator n=1 Tax=Treponema sp. TaxID=166 RepID=UPI001D719FB9|nr:MarR family transcriptional regulator [Treponema sp.]MBS7242129.1 MarR family transcriptional regulator [Treponema sp.]MCI6442859.1 MarR family transcriptional regulator [Spirochaetia bacterium]MDY4132498.1 MarR family transcriptional regulator [Treponema sp.]